MYLSGRTITTVFSIARLGYAPQATETELDQLVRSCGVPASSVAHHPGHGYVCPATLHEAVSDAVGEAEATRGWVQVRTTRNVLLYAGSDDYAMMMTSVFGACRRLRWSIRPCPRPCWVRACYQQPPTLQLRKLPAHA